MNDESKSSLMKMKVF